MFGAVAGCGVLPLSRDACEAVVREGGRDAEASLAGFALGFEAAHAPASAAIGAVLPAEVRRVRDARSRACGGIPGRRLRGPVSRASGSRARGEQRADAASHRAPEVTRECARYLALWMAFDDVIRVADLKCRASRFDRVRDEVAAGADDVVRIVDHFKPGAPEIAGMLPGFVAAPLVAWDRRRQARGKAPFGVALKVRTDGITGFVALRLLAAMKPLRRRGTRFAHEQAAIESGWTRSSPPATGRARTNWHCAAVLLKATARPTSGASATSRISSIPRPRRNVSHAGAACGRDPRSARGGARRRRRQGARPDARRARRGTAPGRRTTDTMGSQQGSDGMTVRIDAAGLRNAADAAFLLSAGCDHAESGAIAHGLVEANLFGHDSHGIGLVPRYLDNLRQGLAQAGRHARIVHDAGALVGMDGDRGFGQVIGEQAMALRSSVPTRTACASPASRTRITSHASAAGPSSAPRRASRPCTSSTCCRSRSWRRGAARDARLATNPSASPCRTAASDRARLRDEHGSRWARYASRINAGSRWRKDCCSMPTASRRAIPRVMFGDPRARCCRSASTRALGSR